MYCVFAMRVWTLSLYFDLATLREIMVFISLQRGGTVSRAVKKMRNINARAKTVKVAYVIAALNTE